MSDVSERPIDHEILATEEENTAELQPQTSSREGIEPPVSGSADPLTTVRDLIALAYQDIVPELLTGDTVEKLLASVPVARESYQRLEARFSRLSHQALQLSPEPLSPPSVTDFSGMSTESLLRQGMIKRRDRANSRPWPKTRP